MSLPEEYETLVAGYRELPEQDKIDCLYMLKRECVWEGPRTAREVASIWRIGLREVNVMLKSAEYGIHRDLIGQRTTLAAEIYSKMEYVAQSAMQAKKAFLTEEGEIVYADAPDHKAAIHGLSKLAEFIGAGRGGVKMKDHGDMPIGELVGELKQLLDKAKGVQSAKSEQPATTATGRGETSSDACDAGETDPASGEPDSSEQLPSW